MTGKMKWILVLLAMSLAVNLFIGGVILGRQFRGGDGPMGGPREHVEFNLRRLAAYLPEEGQAEVREILMQHRRNLRSHFRDMRESEQEIKTLLLAETVDLRALEEAIESHQAKMEGLKAPLRDILLNVIAKLDQETRKALAEDLFARRGPRGEGRPRPPRMDGFSDDRRPPPPPRDGFGPGDGETGPDDRPAAPPDA